MRKPLTIGVAESLFPSAQQNQIVVTGPATDASVRAAVIEALAAGGAQIFLPSALNNGVFNKISLKSSVPLTTGVTFNGVVPTATFSAVLADSGLTYTGGTVFTPATAGSYPCFEAYYNAAAATCAGGSANWVLTSATGLQAGMQVVFLSGGNLAGSGFATNTTYYIASVVGANVQLSSSSTLTPIITNANAAAISTPAFLVATDSTGIGTPVNQAAFEGLAVMNSYIKNIGIDAGFTIGVSSGQANMAGISYGGLDHVWIQGCTRWGVSKINHAHYDENYVFCYNNGSGDGLSGDHLVKSFCDSSIYQPGNSEYHHLYSYNNSCLNRKLVWEAQGNPNTLAASLLNEERVYSGQSNRFGVAAQNTVGGTVLANCTILGDLTVTQWATATTSNVGVASVTGMFVNQCWILASGGPTMPGLTAGVPYFVTSINSGANTFQLAASIGGTPISATGSFTSTPILDCCTFTLSSQTSSILALGLPCYFTGGFGSLTSYFTYFAVPLSVPVPGDTTHFMLFSSRGTVVPSNAVASPGTVVLNSSGFANFEAVGLFNTGWFTGASATSGAAGSGTGTQGYIQNSHFLYCDAEGTSGAAFLGDKCQSSTISFNQLPNSTVNRGIPDLTLRSSQQNKIASPNALNTDIDSGSTHTIGEGTLGSVLQYAFPWSGTFTGNTPGAAGTTSVGVNVGNALNQAAAFYPSSLAAQLGNKLWISKNVGEGVNVTYLTVSATTTLTGANVGTVVVLAASTANIIDLPTLSSTAGQALTNGAVFEIWNLSSATMTLTPNGTQYFNAASGGFTTHALAGGHYCRCTACYSGAGFWLIQDFTISTS